MPVTTAAAAPAAMVTTAMLMSRRARLLRGELKNRTEAR